VEVYNSQNFGSVISATEKLLVSKPPNRTRQESNLEDNLYKVTCNLEACAEKVERHLHSTIANPQVP
jgi:hypothetical protein